MSNLANNTVTMQEILALIGSLPEGGGGNMVYDVLPIGRARGDINGDGYIDIRDYHLGMDLIAEAGDEVQMWAMDVRADGTPNIMDMSTLRDYCNGTTTVLTSTPTLSDYYQNWTYQKVDDTSGYFYYDLQCEKITASSKIVLLTSAFHGSFLEPVCMDGAVRVCAKVCPAAETKCCILILDENIDMESVPPAEVDKTTNNITVNNEFSEVPAYYFSENYPSGTVVPAGGVFVDTLEPGKVYALMYNAIDNSVTDFSYGGNAYVMLNIKSESGFTITRPRNVTDTYNAVIVCRTSPAHEIKFTLEI